jgi:diadenosine tetraphosphate (Ap4A) HIT family hydrolase
MGWLVLVLNRHATALHELTVEEFTEFHLLIPQIITLLQIKFSSTKEYILCLAEKEGFEHVHVHFIPRAADLPDEFKGTKIFGLMGEDGRIPEVELAALCEELQELF